MLFQEAHVPWEAPLRGRLRVDRRRVVVEEEDRCGVYRSSTRPRPGREAAPDFMRTWLRIPKSCRDVGLAVAWLAGGRFFYALLLPPPTNYNMPTHNNRSPDQHRHINRAEYCLPRVCFSLYLTPASWSCGNFEYLLPNPPPDTLSLLSSAADRDFANNGYALLSSPISWGITLPLVFWSLTMIRRCGEVIESCSVAFGSPLAKRPASTIFPSVLCG